MKFETTGRLPPRPADAFQRKPMADLEVARRYECDPSRRYLAGFDRWRYAALKHREITVADSNSLHVALDQRGGIWFWDTDWKIWLGDGHIPREAYAEHAFYLETLQQVTPICALLDGGASGGERSAAAAALQRRAATVRRFFASSSGATCWIGAASLYRDATRDLQWCLPNVFRPPYRDETEKFLSDAEKDTHYAFIQEGAVATAVGNRG